MQEVLSREELEKMSVSQLRRHADEQGIAIPSSWRKGEIVDEIVARMAEPATDAPTEATGDGNEPDAEQPGDTPPTEQPDGESQVEQDASGNEQIAVTPEQLAALRRALPELPDPATVPVHVMEYLKRVLRLQHDVALASVVMANSQAEAKTAKKHFDAVTDALVDLLTKEPQPTLFDNQTKAETVKTCRKCSCTEAEKRFVSDDLCWECAEHLGDSVDEVTPADEPTVGDEPADDEPVEVEADDVTADDLEPVEA